MEPINLLAPVSKEEAQNRLEQWRCLLEKQLALKDVVSFIEASTVETLSGIKEEPVYAYDMGKAAIVLLMRSHGEGFFSPVLFVAEKANRAPNGDKPVKEYAPLKVSGLPNFDRAIRSALDLSIKLTDRPRKRDLPRGVMAAPDKDHFILHIGMIRVSQEQLEAILTILNHEPQPLSGDPSCEASPLEGGFCGESLEVVKEDSDNGGAQEGLVLDPAPDTQDVEQGERSDNTGQLLQPA